MTRNLTSRMLWSADETALDLFARRPTRGFWTGLRFLDAPVALATSTAHGSSDSGGYQPRQVIEIVGDDATPKALVLMQVIAAFLAREGEGNERVFVFDHECELSAHVLLEILKKQIGDQEAARKALDRVVLFRCRDSFQWLATLNHLHFELLDSAPCPYLVVINCVGSLLPMDKMLTKSASLALSEQVFGLLKQFIQHHSPIVMGAKRALTNPRGGPDMAEYMPTSWTSQVSKRIQIRRCDQQKGPDIAFEGRSFSHGSSRSFPFSVHDWDIVEEPSDELMVEPAVVVPIESSEPSLAITEADTNAAQLWMQ